MTNKGELYMYICHNNQNLRAKQSRNKKKRFCNLVFNKRQRLQGKNGNDLTILIFFTPSSTALAFVIDGL